MSINSEAIAAELEAFPESSTFDNEVIGDDGSDENKRELSNSEYEALEEAVMQTAQGRTFLREHALRNRAVATDLVMRAMEDCKDFFKRQEFKQPAEILSAELQNMSDAITHTRRDIAAIKPKEGANNRIMAATEDLDAIVTSTERATNEILAAAERIQETCETLRQGDADGGLCDTMEEDVTNIFLACSFQDLTGQRTTKVVNALQYLEQRVGAMVQIWGSESLRNAAHDEFAPSLEEDEHPEAGLLNGPQMEGQGVAQVDIDQMMGAENDDLDLGNYGGEVDEPVANGADPTEGIDFDAPSEPPSDAESLDRLLEDDDGIAAVEAEVEAEGEAAAEVEVGEEQDDTDYSDLGEEVNNDDIDAMFD